MPTATTDTKPPRVLLLMGVSGCGKTTVGERLAAHLRCPFVDADDLHPSANKAKMSAKIPLTDEDRWPWLQRVREVIDATPPGQQCVLACSALKRDYRRLLMDGAEGVRLIHLCGSFELISARLAARQGHFMPPDLLRSQFATLEAPAPEEGRSVDIDAPEDEIVRQCLAAPALLSERRILTGLGVACLIAGLLVFGWKHIRHFRMTQQALPVLESLESYRRHHGHYPTSLEDAGRVEHGSLYYARESDDAFRLWYGTSLGESVTYSSASATWAKP